VNLYGTFFQAEQFIDETGIDALAVCIGNVHGKYPPSGPNLRLDLLKVRQMQSNYENLYVILVTEHKIFLRKHHSMPHSISELLFNASKCKAFAFSRIFLVNCCLYSNAILQLY
jgi:hypothetical protein